jgi:carbamoyltransferase
MSHSIGQFGPSHPRLGQSGFQLGRSVAKRLAASQQFFQSNSAYARERASALQQKVRGDGTAYLLGIGPGGHNAGVALVEVSQERGVRLVCNNEEERYSGIKHDTHFPVLSLEALREQFAQLGIGAEDIHACVASWDYVALAATYSRLVCEELPESITYLDPNADPSVMNLQHIAQAFRAPATLSRRLGLKSTLPVIGLRHHDNHAYFAYAVSPFAHSSEPVMVAVLDGFGDDGAISLYLARNGRLDLVRCNHSIVDSLGVFYSVISSTQGGWTVLSSEGRYMGAAGWGNSDRLTNPYYRELRQIFHFGSDGTVWLNRALARWPRRLLREPYSAELKQILGEPIPQKAMWNPDAVLNVEDVRDPVVTQERLDRAAAVQLVFEDALFHILDHLIRSTGSYQLVLSGGTALNCIANMHLLERFDESYYERYGGRKRTRLHLWVPPTPGDAGAPVGAAFHFAMKNGASPGEPLRHAFYAIPQNSLGHVVRWEHFPTTHQILELSIGLFG